MDEKTIGANLRILADEIKALNTEVSALRARSRSRSLSD